MFKNKEKEIKKLIMEDEREESVAGVEGMF